MSAQDVRAASGPEVQQRGESDDPRAVAGAVHARYLDRAQDSNLRRVRVVCLALLNLLCRALLAGVLAPSVSGAAGVGAVVVSAPGSSSASAGTPAVGRRRSPAGSVDAASRAGKTSALMSAASAGEGRRAADRPGRRGAGRR